jgi:hypothetical protein
MIEKLVTFAPKCLITIAVLVFATVGIVKYTKYLKTRPARPKKLPEPILSKMATETKAVPEKIKYPADINKIDFGFSQGVKFSFGFWFGTILFFFFVAVVFGSIITGVTSSFIAHSIQGAFVRP